MGGHVVKEVAGGMADLARRLRVGSTMVAGWTGGVKGKLTVQGGLATEWSTGLGRRMDRRDRVGRCRSIDESRLGMAGHGLLEKARREIKTGDDAEMAM